MATPLTDDEREQIAQLLHDGLSRAKIAREVGRSVGTIANVAKSIGFQADQSAALRTQRAREARRAFCAERRAEQMESLSEEFDRLLVEMRQPAIVFNFGGKNNTYREHQLSEPPIDSKRQLMAAARDAMRTMLDVARYDERADEGVSDVDEWLRHQMGESVQAGAT